MSDVTRFLKPGLIANVWCGGEESLGQGQEECWDCGVRHVQSERESPGDAAFAEGRAFGDGETLWLLSSVVPPTG